MKLGKHTWTKPQLLLLAAFAAYVWVQLWCVRWYDPWRDVSQAWCIVRDLSIPQIFAQLRYEGHPFLWYALLWPLAKLGLPFESILVLSTALMVGAAAVLVRFAPLPWYAKAACLFSVPFIYYLPTVARSYALAGLLLVLCAALYGARHTRPLRYAAVLFLLCQVHVMLCGFVGFLMAQWALEMLARSVRAKKLAGADAGALALMAGGVLLLAVQLAGSVQSNSQVSLQSNTWMSVIKKFLIDAFRIFFHTELYYYFVKRGLLMLLPLLAVLAWLLWRWLRAAPLPLLAWLCGTAYCLVLQKFLVYNTVQRHVVMGMMFVCALWMSVPDIAASARLTQVQKGAVKRGIGVAMLVFSLLTVPAMLRSLQEVVRPPQENVRSETIAQALAEVTEPDAVLFTDNEFYISLFSAYQPGLEFRNPARSEPISFTTWDGLEDGIGGGTMSVREAVEALRADPAVGNRPLYFFTTGAMALSDAPVYIEQAAEQGVTLTFVGGWHRIAEEEYVLFRVENKGN